MHGICPQSPVCANTRALMTAEVIKAAEWTYSFAMMTLASLTAHMCCQPLSSQGHGWISAGPQGRCCEMPVEGLARHSLVRVWGTRNRRVHREQRASHRPGTGTGRGPGQPWDDLPCCRCNSQAKKDRGGSSPRHPLTS